MYLRLFSATVLLYRYNEFYTWNLVYTVFINLINNCVYLGNELFNSLPLIY